MIKVILFLCLFVVLNSVDLLSQDNLSDQEKYMRLSALAIKQIMDVPAANQERLIPQIIDNFRRQYPDGDIYFRASFQAWSKNPDAYCARYPDIFIEKEQDTSASSAPKLVTKDTLFIGDIVSFPSDSEWQVVEAVSIGKNLPTIEPFAKGKTTEGKYIIVIYRVKNITGKSESIFYSPTIIDESGNKYKALPDEALWTRKLTDSPSITIEQLPNRVAKKFAAIYEIPDDGSIYYFEARQLASSNPRLKPIVLAPRANTDVNTNSDHLINTRKTISETNDGVINAHVVDKNGKIVNQIKHQQAPLPLFQANAKYPVELRKLGVSGEVEVEFIVDKNGQVQRAYAIRSTRRELEVLAVEAVLKWEFQPGKIDGLVVDTKMQTTIEFKLFQH